MITREEVRRRITNAYYDARNSENGTMETAADEAAAAVMALVVEERRKIEALRDDLVSFHGGHGDFRVAGRALTDVLDRGDYDPII